MKGVRDDRLLCETGRATPGVARPSHAGTSRGRGTETSRARPRLPGRPGGRDSQRAENLPGISVELKRLQHYAQAAFLVAEVAFHDGLDAL